MDFKFNGRTWAGNIYHKFETMCQEVDDFVTKDSVKYVENQVQTVGESVKKLYSNVVHDFLPPVVDNKPNEGKHVTKKQNDALGTCVKSMVGIKGNHGHDCERKSFKEKGNASEVGHQRQHSFPPNLPFQKQAETDFYSEDRSNICTSKNGEVVHEENVTEEESTVSRISSFQDGKSSLNLREQHPFPENLDSPEHKIFSGAIEISADGDRSYVCLTKYSPEKTDEDVDFRTSQNDKTVYNSDDHSEKAKTGMSWEHNGVNEIYNTAKIGTGENVTKKVHHVSEGANTIKDKDSSGLKSCSKEQHQMADDSLLPQDEKSLVQSSANDDFKSNVQGKRSSIVWLHDTRPSVAQAEGNLCDNADPSEETEANLSSEIPSDAAKLGFSLEENVVKDMPIIVEFKSLSDDKSCAKLSLCSREQCPLFEEFSNLEVEKFSESTVIPANENPKVTIGSEFPPATSIHNQELRGFLGEGNLCDIADPSKEEEKDLSQELDADSTCMCSDLAGAANSTLMEYAVEESISSPKLEKSSELSLCSIKLQSPVERLDSLLKTSPPWRDEDTKSNVFTKFSQAKSVHDAELDETICRTNPASELLSSNFCVENKVTEAKVTALNSPVSKESLKLPDISYKHSTQKEEKGSNNYTDSSSCVSFTSSIPSGSFSDLAYDEKAVNIIPAFPSKAVSAVSGEHGDDSAVDIADLDMETIDLSDKVNLDDSCIIVDNRSHFAVSSRPRKFRSYKKLIQDAFASRKRLIKEYEQLTIWYGDIEAETCPRPKQNIFPPVTVTTSSSSTSQTSDLCDLEWELL